MIIETRNIEEIRLDENYKQVSDYQCSHLNSELYRGEIWRAIREEDMGAIDLCDKCNDDIIDLRFIYSSTENLVRRFYARIERGE